MSRGLFVTGLLAASGLVLAGERLPYRVELEVAYADRRGPESIREAIQVAALEALRQRGCFMELEGEAPVLRARVLLAGLREETSFETGLAEQARPSSSDTALAQVARLEIGVQVELTAPGGDQPALRRRFSTRNERRPLTWDEDTLERVREEAILSTGARIASILCGVSPRKLRGASGSRR